MLLGKVVGTVVSTMKHESLEGQKLLIVQPQMADEKTPDGHPLVAVDGVGAGTGETVFITSDGRVARAHLGADNAPVRWMVIGVRDA